MICLNEFKRINERAQLRFKFYFCILTFRIYYIFKGLINMYIVLSKMNVQAFIRGTKVIVDKTMNVGRHKTFRYIKATNLTDDFRRLQSTTPLDLDYSWEVDNCPICLDVHDDPVVLGCKHTFCKICLQYTIDKTLPSTRYDDRGFVCAVCGYFTKVWYLICNKISE